MIKLAGASEKSVFSQVERRDGAEGKAGAAAPTAAWTSPVGAAPCDPNGLGRRPSAPRPSRARPRLHLARDQFGTRRCSTGSGEERRTLLLPPLVPLGRLAPACSEACQPGEGGAPRVSTSRGALEEPVGPGSGRRLGVRVLGPGLPGGGVRAGAH